MLRIASAFHGEPESRTGVRRVRKDGQPFTMAALVSLRDSRRSKVERAVCPIEKIRFRPALPVNLGQIGNESLEDHLREDFEACWIGYGGEINDLATNTSNFRHIPLPFLRLISDNAPIGPRDNHPLDAVTGRLYDALGHLGRVGVRNPATLVLSQLHYNSFGLAAFPHSI